MTTWKRSRSERPHAEAPHFEEAQRVAAIGSWEYRIDGGVIVWSDQLFRMYDLDPETDEPLTGAEFRARVDPRDRAEYTRLETAMYTGGPWAGDLRIVRADGSLRVYRLQGTSEVEDGRVVRTFGTTQDVTEIRATERRLRESEQRLVAAQRVAGVGSFEGCRETGEFEWTEELYRLFGLDPSTTKWSVDEFVARMAPGAARDFVSQPAPSPRPFHIEHRMRRADDVIRRYEVRGESYLKDGRIHVRGTVRDITDLRRSELQQAAVARIGLAALQRVPIGELLALACREVAGVLEAGMAGIFELRPGEDRLELVAAHGELAPSSTAWLPASGRSLPALALANGGPVTVEDWRQGSDYDRPRLTVTDLEPRSGMAVPIRTHAGGFGSLGVLSLTPDVFGPETVDFVVSVANAIGLVLERREREAQIEALAALRGRLVAQTVEAEERVRRRVSETIHDGPLQNLLAARQDLVEAADSPRSAELLGRGREGIERAVEELREAVHALHPVVLQHGGLEAALKAAADHTARTGGFAARVQVDRRAAGRHDELVLSLARELLTNAAKHAGASEVVVTVACEGDDVVLEVADDGRGIPAGRRERAPAEGHIGLASITERVEAVGGRLDIDARAAGGTRIRATVPAPPIAAPPHPVG